MRRQKKQKDYWDEYEDYNLDLSSDKSNCDKFSLDSLSFDKKKEDVIEENEKKEGMHKGLRDNEKRVLLEDNKSILKLVWKKDTSSYL